MVEKINPIRETNDEALALARKLVEENRYAALGVLEPETGAPVVSRVSIGWAQETGLFFAASDLSHHSKSILENGMCSLLLGEPGKGDGLAHPRITIVGETRRMPNEDANRAIFREVFVARHPKAELYIDFADFGFYPFSIDRAYLNGGFGKAFHLNQDDLAFIGG